MKIHLICSNALEKIKCFKVCSDVVMLSLNLRYSVGKAKVEIAIMC